MAFEAKGLRLVDPESDFFSCASAPVGRCAGSGAVSERILRRRAGTRTPMTFRSEIFKFSLVRFVLRQGVSLPSHLA